VSHDYQEIRKMADWMIRMDNGAIVEEGSPSTLLKLNGDGLSAIFHGLDKEGMALFSRDGKFFTLPASLVEIHRWQVGQEVLIRIEG
jgi:energy-coupling factor transporter ATP-binding protein EcfA2